MLTKEMYLKLYEGVMADGEEQMEHAARVVAVAEKYAAELMTVEVREGENVRTLKWNELPKLYRKCFIWAMLMEYGWQEALKNSQQKNDAEIQVCWKGCEESPGDNTRAPAEKPDEGWKMSPVKPLLPLGLGITQRQFYVGGEKLIWMWILQYITRLWSRKDPLTITIDRDTVTYICKTKDRKEIQDILSNVEEMLKGAALESRRPDGRMQYLCPVFQTVIFDEDPDKENVYAEASETFTELVRIQLAMNDQNDTGEPDHG